MKANFKVAKPSLGTKNMDKTVEQPAKSNATKEEFEEFISKAGAAGSFMIFRSDKKEDELGLDEL